MRHVSDPPRGCRRAPSRSGQSVARVAVGHSRVFIRRCTMPLGANQAVRSGVSPSALGLGAVAVRVLVVACAVDRGLGLRPRLSLYEESPGWIPEADVCWGRRQSLRKGNRTWSPRAHCPTWMAGPGRLADCAAATATATSCGSPLLFANRSRRVGPLGSPRRRRVGDRRSRPLHLPAPEA